MKEKEDVTRRNFLKTAASVAAAAALPAAGAMAETANRGSNQAVRYGFIGSGTQGCTLLRFLATIAEGRCVANCDIYPPNLKKGVEAIGSKPDTYGDYRRVLDRKDIDAVLIATPLYLHAQMTIDSLEAGKHVFIEKSMFFKEEEAEQVRRAVAAHPKQILQVGLHRRSSVLYQVAIEMVRKGALGKVLLVQSRVTTNGSWRRPVADAKYERLINWRMYREYSGGLMAEMGSHFIDIANWVFEASPVSVIGTGGLDYWKDGREVHDNVQAIFDYGAGRRHYFNSMLFNGHRSNGVMIMGDQGTLDVTDNRGIYFRETVAKVSSGPAKENWWAGSTVSKAAAPQGLPIFPEKEGKDSGFVDRELRYARRWLASMGIYDAEEPYDPYWGELVNFFASIRENKAVIAPLEVGVADAMAVINANRAIDMAREPPIPKKSA
jgi:predicted dehydrogenase